MKIFISYGHEDHTQVVNLLFDALVREGHEPWKDDRYEGNSGIPAGRDFTEVIYRKIEESDFVIAFVTRKTVNKPYCRDERQKAYDTKGCHFIQIRMDYADITLGNARSYIDMTDVVASNGEINDRIFEEKLKALFAAFRDPLSFAEGGFTPWAKFDTHLKVQGALKYREFVASLKKEDFVGREWLLEKCKGWVMDPTILCRLFVVLGEAGTGKTAFVRRLAADETLVHSVHICVYDKPSTRNAVDTLKNLAYVLAQNNSHYFDFLKMRNLEKIQDMSLDGLFEFLFIEPLKTETQKFLLIIDGLDEMEEKTGFKPLMRIFRQYAHQINPNISFLVTGRPDAYITDMLQTIAQGKTMESVMLDKDASKDDLRRFIVSKLRQLDCYREDLVEMLLDACDGNFEYLSLLFREAQEEGLRVFDGAKLPRGLNERYIQYLDRRMEAMMCSRLSREQRQLLSALCTAYEPLSVPVLCAVTGLEEYDIADELELFGSLIHRIDGAEVETRICLFTKSFRDFLLSKSFEKYRADRKLGVRLLAQYLINQCHSEEALKKYPYMDRCGFAHLLQYAQEAPDEVVAYCKRLEASGVDVSQRIANALLLGEQFALDGYWKLRKEIGQHTVIVRSLKTKRNAEVLQEIVSMYKNADQIFDALILEADMLLWDNTPEASTQAEVLYRNALETAEQNYQANSNFESRRNLAIACGRLGDRELQKRSADGNAQAEQWYLKRLEYYKQNHQANPSYESRRDLAIVYQRLGDLAERKRTPDGDAQAEQWYLQMLDYIEQNFQANPSYETRRDLSVTYLRLGRLAERKRIPDADAQAERWYLKMLELREQNYQVNPSHESRRDLFNAYEHLGSLAERKGTSDGDAQAEQCYIKAQELCEQDYQANPNYRSRRNLVYAYRRLGSLAERKGTPDGDVQAEQCRKKVLELQAQEFKAQDDSEC